MSGIYVHIPYCKQKCIYCNFYSIATKKSKDNYIQALVKEIEKYGFKDINVKKVSSIGTCAIKEIIKHE